MLNCNLFANPHLHVPGSTNYPNDITVHITSLKPLGLWLTTWLYRKTPRYITSSTTPCLNHIRVLLRQLLVETIKIWALLRYSLNKNPPNHVKTLTIPLRSQWHVLNTFYLLIFIHSNPNTTQQQNNNFGIKKPIKL